MSTTVTLASYRRVLDEKATEAARARQAAGVERLNAMFGFSPDDFPEWERSRRVSFPAGERRVRRARNKAARKARARNRA